MLYVGMQVALGKLCKILRNIKHACLCTTTNVLYKINRYAIIFTV